jgi:hypothetical protein
MSARTQQIRTFYLTVALEPALAALVAGTWTFYLAGLFPSEVYSVADIWFGADQSRVLPTVITHASDHYRTKVHPIFSLLMLPFGSAFTSLGLASLTAAKLLLAVCASASVGLLHITVRQLGLGRFDSLLICLVYMASASFIFWSGLMETFPVAALSVAAMVCIAAINPAGMFAWFLGSAGTLAITTTNWSLGVVAAYFHLSQPRFLQVTIGALMAVMMLAGVQKLLLPTAILFYSPSVIHMESVNLHVPHTLRGLVQQIVARGANFWLHTGVSPKPRLYKSGITPEEKATITSSGLRTVSSLSLVALGSWTSLLGLGMIGAAYNKTQIPLTPTLASFLAIQMCLHMFFGDAPFLYSMHFLPAMIVLSAYGFLGPFAELTRGAAVTFVITGALSNYLHFKEGIGLLTIYLAR